MTAVIVTALMIPGPDLPKVGFNGIDLLVHLCLFGAWGAAVQWEWAPRWWQQLLLGAAFAVGTETLQTLAVQRTFSVSNIVADFVGVSLGAALAWAVRQRSRQAVGASADAAGESHSSADWPSISSVPSTVGTVVAVPQPSEIMPIATPIRVRSRMRVLRPVVSACPPRGPCRRPAMATARSAGSCPSLPRLT